MNKHIKLREKFLKHNIPYDHIDVEMIELIDVLNFKFGLKTQFCCYGHKAGERIEVIFDGCVKDAQIYRTAEKVTSMDMSIHFNKWLRSLNNELVENWRFTLGISFDDPSLPDKKEYLDAVVEKLKNFKKV